MKQIRKTLTGLALLSSLLCTHTVQAQPSDMWDDPAFVKSFTASYGVLAGYEPEIKEEEKAVLAAVLQAIKSNPQSAIRQLEPQIKPKTSGAFDFILANLYFQSGNLQKAERFYNSAIRKYPNFRRAHKNLGLVQVQAGKYVEAIEPLSKALELGEVDGRAYGLIGYGYMLQELYYPAEAAYRQAILIQPKITDWKLGLANCLQATQRYPEAISLYDTLIKLDPNNSELWLLQANAHIANNDPSTAASNLEVVRRMGKADLRVLSLLGNIYMNSDMPELALDAYLAAVDLAGDSDQDSLVNAAQLLTNTANYEQAQQMIDRTRGHYKETLSNQNDLQLLTQEGRIARKRGQQELAAEKLQLIIARDALNGRALIELGRYHAEQGDFGKAINRFEQAQKIEAFEREALIAHARTLVDRAQYDEALPLLNRALYLEHGPYLKDYLQRVERAARNNLSAK